MSKEKTFKNQVDDLRSKIIELKTVSELEEALRLIKNINKKIDILKKEFEQAEPENLEQPLLKSIKNDKNDFELLKNEFQKKEDEWLKKKREKDYYNRDLNETDSKKAQKEIVLDQHKQIDNQGIIIESIAENVKGANENLKNVNAELNDQNEQIDRIQEKTYDTEKIVVQTGKKFRGMERRAKCMQYLMCITVFVLGIFDAFWIVFSILRKVT